MFQTKLRELRELSGYKSQQAFADAFGVAQSTVGGWEAGKREPNYETTFRLAEFFNVLIGRLLDAEKPDDCSTKFRKNLASVLDQIRESLYGDEECMGDYYELCVLAESSYPLYLAEACEVADKVGESVSYLLQDDIGDSPLENKKSLGTDESAPRDDQEKQIMGFVKKLDPEQKDFLLALLNTVLARNQETPVSAQASIGETVLKSGHQDFSK